MVGVVFFTYLGGRILKRIFRLMVLVALMMVAVGCGARNVTLPMPQNLSNTKETGTLIIRLSASMHAVSVTIDEDLVVEEKTTQRIQVNGLGAGLINVNVFGKDRNYSPDLDVTSTMEIRPGETTTMLVQTPSKSIGHYVKKVILWGVPMGLLVLAQAMGGTN